MLGVKVILMFMCVFGLSSPLMGSSFRLSPLANLNEQVVTLFLPHEAGLLELEFHLLGWVQVVKDHEALRQFCGLQLAEVD